MFVLKIIVCFVGLLPLASSKRCPQSLMSMVPAGCSPVIQAQEESDRPETGGRSPDTAAAEPHNLACRISLPVRWCQCPIPCLADGPVDLLQMSSSQESGRSKCPSLSFLSGFTDEQIFRQVNTIRSTFVSAFFIALSGSWNTGSGDKQGGAARTGEANSSQQQL